MFNNYLDPNTYLPRHLGEIYSDRHIRLTGQATLTSGNLVTTSFQIITTPAAGGGASVSLIPDNTYTLTNIGDSIWCTLNRSPGSSSVIPVVCAVGTMPKPSENLYMIGYKVSATEVITSSFIVVEGRTTFFGYGLPLGEYNKIVGNQQQYATLVDASPTAGDRILVMNSEIYAGTATWSFSDVYIEFLSGVSFTFSSSVTDALTVSGSNNKVFGLNLLTSNAITNGLVINGMNNQFYNTTINAYFSSLNNGLYVSGSKNIVIGECFASTGTLTNKINSSNVPVMGAGNVAILSGNIFTSGTTASAPQGPYISSPTTLDCSTSNIFYGNYAAAPTINVVNMVNGQVVLFKIKNTGGSPYTMGWSGGYTFKWPADITTALNSYVAAGRTNIYQLLKVDSNTLYCSVLRDYNV